MNTIANSTQNAAPAEAQAANFQVAELEPRLENMWAGTNPGGEPVETAEPTKK